MKKPFLLLLLALITGLTYAQKSYTYVQSSGQNTSGDLFKSKLYTTTNLMEVRGEIGLTDAQVAKIKKLHAENSGQFSTLKWDLDDATAQMKKMLDQPKIDPAAVTKQLDEILKLENQMKRIQVSTMVAIKNELTPEQIEKLEVPKTFYFNNGGIVTGEKITGFGSSSSGSTTLNGTAITTSPKVAVTVNGNGAEPLYFIESKSGYSKILSLEKIDPSDIESISVLKGEKAVEKFGDEGKNGVIIIKMKGGKEEFPLEN